MTVSIGGAWGGRRADRDALLIRADSVLYAAKHAGRNCCRFVPGWLASVPDTSEADLDCDGSSGRGACARNNGLVDDQGKWRDAAA